MKEFNFSILGMSCVSCAKTVERVIASFDSVASVKVDFSTSSANVIFKEDVNLSNIRKKLRMFGYDIIPNSENVDLSRDFRKVVLAFICSVPIFVYMLLKMIGIILVHSFWIEFGLFLLSSFVVLVFGFTVHKSGVMAIFYRSPNMDSLISIGVLSALLTYILSFFLPINNFSFEAVIVMDVFLLGNYLKVFYTTKATKSLRELYSLISNKAYVLENGREVEKSIEEVKKGDIILVKSYEKVPVDGVVVEGSSNVEESFITGESLPIIKRVGDRVFSGSYNLEGVLKIEVIKELRDSFLYKLIEFVEDIKNNKFYVQDLADKVIKYFVPAVFLLSLLSFSLWTILGDLNKGVVSFVSVLVIACPCALGIAIPTAIYVGFTVLSKRGVLIRNVNAIKKLKEANLFAFDKTGTLTYGKPSITKLSLKEEYLKHLLSLVSLSNHPFSVSLREYLETNYKLDVVPVSEFKVIVGEGIEGIIEGKSFKFVRSKNSNSSSEFLVKEGSEFIKIGEVEFFDKPMKDAKIVVDYFKSKGEVIMLTGDKCMFAKNIGEYLGIDKVYCELYPDDKVKIVEKFKKEGSKVCFIGDGVNDAPVISVSDVGIVVSDSDNVISNVGDFVVIKDSFKSIVFLHIISKVLSNKVLQNLLWAFCYNIVAIPIAFLGLLTPDIAEVVMALSSLSVVLNSLSIYRFANKV